MTLSACKTTLYWHLVILGDVRDFVYVLKALWVHQRMLLFANVFGMPNAMMEGAAGSD